MLAAVPQHGVEAVLVAVELVLESGRPSAEHVLNVLARLKAGSQAEVAAAKTPLTLAVAPQASVLLAGPSGAGKSTVFRALAGIWPHAQGTVCLPPDSMFIPQRPYMPNGSLRAAQSNTTNTCTV